jgi:hypothetical protein
MDNDSTRNRGPLSLADAPELISLTELLARLGAEWRETLRDALISRNLKWESRELKDKDGKNQLYNFNWDETYFNLEKVKIWLVGLRDTGNGHKVLPLADRARLGLLVLEPVLLVSEVAKLEHPSDDEARKAIEAAIIADIEDGELPDLFFSEWVDYNKGGLSRRFKDPLDNRPRQQSSGLFLYKKPQVDRETYRIWRAKKCLKRLLSDLSKIHKWLGLSSIPLLEIEQRGLLALTDELSVEDIIWLEAGENSTLGKEWESEIWKAIHNDEEKDCLPAWVMPVSDALPGITFVHRDNYRIWRTSQSEPPADSKIHLWLGAMPAIESTPVAPIPPAKPNAKPKDTDDGIALVGMENAALIALRKELKREPDFDEFWHYLTTRDDTGTVADCTDDRLYWIGKASSSCDTAKSTIRNRLTKAKKRNPYTPS